MKLYKSTPPPPPPLVGIASLLLVSMSAHAEWLLGVEYGFSKSTVESKGDLTDGDEDDSAGNYGLIGQWRTSTNPGEVSYGVHIGYGQNNSEYEDSASGEIDLLDVGDVSDEGTLTGTVAVEQGSTFDLLGAVVWNNGSYRPYVMAGYSTVELESKITFTGSEFTNGDFNATFLASKERTLSGYKLAAGVEGDFSDSWVWNVGLTYADYGDKDFTFTFPVPDLPDPSVTEKVSLDSTTLQFGIKYRF